MHVLIIDDSRFLRLANERTLLKAGLQVTTASDGEEGLRLAIEQKPNLIVLDMMLPNMPGQQVLQILRKDPATASIPIMVLTSLPQANEKKLLGEGATAYFEKSLLSLSNGSGSFLEAVEKLLSNPMQSKAAVV